MVPARLIAADIGIIAQFGVPAGIPSEVWALWLLQIQKYGFVDIHHAG
jgi:hypothetical protein